MFLEMIVASVCIVGQDGCGSATSAYYHSNKELQEAVKNAEQYGQRLVNGHEYVVYAVTPLYAVVSGKPAIIKLSRGLNLNVDIKGSAVALQWNY